MIRARPATGRPDRVRRPDDRARHPRPRGAADRADTGIPFDHILINATHTHHAPTTVTIHGYQREEAFTRQVEDRTVEAAAGRAAAGPRRVSGSGWARSRRSGKNSRLLLGDGTIYWVGRTTTRCVRPARSIPSCPSGVPPARRRLEAVLFNHSTHTIGTLKPGVRSPSFYGLAAQELEKEQGGTFLFFEGASGSTHNLDLTAVEAAYRIKQAVTDALDRRPADRPDRAGSRGRKEITLKVRKFDEAADERRWSPTAPSGSRTRRRRETIIETFRAMRKVSPPGRGRTARPGSRRSSSATSPSWACRASSSRVLGQEIKRRSPYRYTYVFELANDYVGYIPDGRLRPGRLSGLDGPAQLPRARQRRDHRRGGRRPARAAPRSGLASGLAVIRHLAGFGAGRGQVDSVRSWRTTREFRRNGGQGTERAS